MWGQCSHSWSDRLLILSLTHLCRGDFFQGRPLRCLGGFYIHWLRYLFCAALAFLAGLGSRLEVFCVGQKCWHLSDFFICHLFGWGKSCWSRRLGSTMRCAVFGNSFENAASGAFWIQERYRRVLRARFCLEALDSRHCLRILFNLSPMWWHRLGVFQRSGSLCLVILQKRHDQACSCSGVLTPMNHCFICLQFPYVRDRCVHQCHGSLLLPLNDPWKFSLWHHSSGS